VHAAKGASQGGKPILGKPTMQDINWRGDKIRRGAKQWPIGTDTAKGLLYGRMRNANVGSPGYMTLSKRFGAEIFEGLTSERLVTRYIKGRAKLEWVKTPGVRNEPLDGAVYALAAAHYRGVDRWKGGEWAKWQALLEPTHEPTRPAAEAPQPVTARAPGGKISLAGMTRFKPKRGRE
jgi:phage terminase large subunit GpA-like protein